MSGQQPHFLIAVRHPADRGVISRVPGPQYARAFCSTLLRVTQQLDRLLRIEHVFDIAQIEQSNDLLRFQIE